MISDTDPKTRELLLKLLRSMTKEEKLRRTLGLSVALRKLLLTHLRSRHPQASEDDIRKLFAERLYGRDFVEQYLK